MALATWKVTVPAQTLEVQAEDEGEALMQAEMKFSFMNEAQAEEIVAEDQ